MIQVLVLLVQVRVHAGMGILTLLQEAVSLLALSANMDWQHLTIEL